MILSTLIFSSPRPGVISSKDHSLATSNQLVKKIVLCYLGERQPQEYQTQKLNSIYQFKRDLMRPKVAGHVNESRQAACSQTLQPLHSGGWWVGNEPGKVHKNVSNEYFLKLQDL